jgi:3-oxoacyl-[acyl-carrier-protein] synthase II
MVQRVVITGCGAVTPVGNDVDTFWNALATGVSGIGPIQAFDVSAYPTRIAGEVKNFDPGLYLDPKEARRTDRVILFAVAASTMAVKHAGLDPSREDLTRCGVIIGSGIGGLRTLEDEHSKLIAKGPSRVSPFLIPMMISDMAAGMVAINCGGFKGPNYSVVSACASGAHAIGDSFVMLRAGMMDVAICGGTEATITPISLAGFCNMKAMTTRNENPQKASSPFDQKRDGFVMGEGAGIVVLETLEHAQKRGATIIAELVGYGATGDAFHISAPSPDGEGAKASMVNAIKMAGIAPAQVDYINAHGTSTPLNDKLESMAIQNAFGDAAATVAISSTKSMTGHLLGASGGIEFIATALAVKNDLIPPTINYEDPDPECPLNYTPNAAVKKTVRYALSNNFGFGGHNASLLVRKYESAPGNA